MITKNKTYTYEEIDKIYMKAMSKTLKDLNEQMAETQAKSEKKLTNPMGNLIFDLHNMMVLSELAKNLFEQEGEE